MIMKWPLQLLAPCEIWNHFYDKITWQLLLREHCHIDIVREVLAPDPPAAPAIEVVPKVNLPWVQ